ncbi:beta strand repeat-containing protein [Terriglobus roseus]|nr:putative Ig domain-containing protein [Terriglobus roseus]
MVQIPQTTTHSSKWVLSGIGCNGANCGTVEPSLNSIIYTAPATVQSQIHVTAATDDTTGKFDATVNPALKVSASLKSATVNTAYTATVSTSGGSSPTHIALSSGALPAGMQFNASNGQISGTPTTVGDYPVTFQATDASVAGTATTVQTTFHVLADSQTSPINITTSSLDVGIVNLAYSAVLTANGGTTPYTWTIASGSLPAGIALSGDGVISGTPTTAGTSTFTAQITDSSGLSSSVPLTLLILNTGAPSTPLTISAPPAGTVGTAYTGTIGVSGGLAPYSCSVAAGLLPDGLVLNGCVLTGTPTTAGSYPFDITATDAASPSNSFTATIVVNIVAAATQLTIGPPASATAGVPYNGSISVSGGKGPYTCSIISGSLPAGITQNNCALQGTPSASGTFPIRVNATDSSSPANTATATFSLVVSAGAGQLTLASPQAATVGATYNAAIGITGGTAPYTCSITSGTLPNGLSLNGCSFTGIPTTEGSYPLGVKVSDSSSTPISTTGNIVVTVGSAAASLVISSPAAGTVGTAYSGTIGVSGGTAPYTCSLIGGSLPAGITQNNCALRGTPTTSGNFSFAIKATDSSSPANTRTSTLSLVVNAAAGQLILTSPAAATVGKAYSGVIGVTGGTAPYRCSLASGTLPAGLALSGCTLIGTPTTAGSYSLGIKASDSSSTPISTTGNIAVTVNAAPVTLVLTSPAPATVGVSYNSTIGVSGGTAPYTCTIVGGTLPAGITQNNCSVAGNPSASGTFSFAVRATDSGNPANTRTSTLSLVVNAAPGQLNISSPAAATVGKAYSGVIGVTGGTAPYMCSIASGTVPAGLALNGCTLVGTPTTAGNYSLGIKASDSSATPISTTGNVVVTVNAAPVTLILTSPAPATVGVSYNSTIGISGGTAPYTCTITGGTLPAGITQNNCALTGTASASGTFSFAVRATDSSSPANTRTSTLSLVVNPAAGQLILTAPAAATVGKAYSGTIGVSGGTAPYRCSLVSGSVPAGLALNGCTLNGTPTTAGSYSLGIKASDSSATVISTTSTILVTVNAAPVTLTLTAPAAATQGTVYSGIIGVTGGTAPYTCTITGGNLPAGITQNNCALTGTPSASGTFSIAVQATDSSSPANSRTATLSFVVNAAAGQLTLTSPPAATVGSTYTGNIGVTGGTAPYTCSLVSGTVPAGLTLNGCAIAGTPTASGRYSLSIKATDSSATPISTTGNVVVRVNAAATLTLTSPAAGTVGTSYSGTIGVRGGTAPYTCSLTSGTVPAGLTLSGCTLMGTPTTAGTSTLVISASDSSATPVTASGNITVTINAAPAVTLTLSAPPAATVGTAYTGTIGVSGGTAPYTCALASGTAPAGLTLNNCTLSGTPTTAGSFILSIKASDSSTPANSTTANVTAVVNAAASTTPSGSPHINYTDLNIGSGTGGDNGNGVYVRIFGANFGSSQGSSNITLGNGSLVTNCSLCSWSDTQIIAQVGSAASTGQIVATVNGLQSNGVPFTVTPTTIVFVSPNGSDSNNGSFTSPYKTWRAAFNSVTSNDSKSPSQNTVIYLEPGTDVTFDDGRGYKAAISTDRGGSSATSQLSIVGYPGGTVTVGSSSITNGVKGWGNYITVANLTIIGQVSAVDAEAGDVRIINNSISCPAPPSGVGGTACVLGETTDPTETWVFQGNNVHDTGGNVDKTYHAVYFSSNVNHADVGWNNVGQNFKGYCRGIMFHATLGDNQYDLHIHDNIVTNSYCDGIALASVNPSLGTVEVYNNVVSNAALASNPYGVANEAGIAINTDPAGGGSSGNVEVYNNTVVNAGAYTLGNQNGCFGVVLSGAGMHLTNNICDQPSSSQPYIEKGSTNVSGSNNLWYGAGAAPSWDPAPITLNPLLSGIFSLLGLSPASGAGTTSIMSPFDILGNARGSRPSVGAYQ